MGMALILLGSYIVKDFIFESLHRYIPLGFAITALLVGDVHILIENVDIDVGGCAAQNGHDVSALYVDDYL